MKESFRNLFNKVATAAGSAWRLSVCGLGLLHDGLSHIDIKVRFEAANEGKKWGFTPLDPLHPGMVQGALVPMSDEEKREHMDRYCKELRDIRTSMVFRRSEMKYECKRLKSALGLE